MIEKELLRRALIIFFADSSPMELFRDELDADDTAKAHRKAVDEHMSMISRRSTEEIEMISKINRDIFTAIDSK